MIEWIKNRFRRKSDKIKLKFELENGKYYEEFVDPDNFEQRIEELQKRFNPRKSLEETTFIWCLVGNIIDEEYRANKEIRTGIKHFSPNTKVYCFPAQWGDGYENIRVIGRHRKSKRYITLIIQSKYITNWRLQKVYRPYILKVMHSENGWSDSEKDKETIIEMLKWLPNRTMRK